MDEWTLMTSLESWLTWFTQFFNWECDQMKTLNIVQTQNYNLGHWKMSTDHKKALTEKCQQNLTVVNDWYCVDTLLTLKSWNINTILILY